MPVHGFLTSIADKAQNALKDTPLAQHIPSSRTGATPNDSGPTQKNPTLGQIQHQFRQLQQTYSTTTPVQKLITAEKGINLDFESLSRNVRAQSKELYTWGQQEELDVKDVTDRLGFLNYVTGSLASTLAGKLDKARAPLKELRNKEVTLTQRRNVRAGLQNQVGRLEHSQEKGAEKNIAELKGQLARAEKDDETIEREHEILLRKALKESELEKFQALREYGEKLALVSQAAEALLAVLPSVPPSSERPYAGIEETGTIRASLQHSLDNWKPGQVTLAIHAGATLDRSHTQSFGETHAKELQQINTAERHADPASPPGEPTTAPAPAPVPSPDLGSTTVPSTTSAEESPVPATTQDLSSTTKPSTTTTNDSDINPAVGAKEPVPTPSTSSPVAASVASPVPVDTDSKVPSVAPAVSETGESSSNAVPKHYESAEEEKKRLEREEREKILQGQTPTYGASESNEEGETPPPYQDI